MIKGHLRAEFLTRDYIPIAKITAPTDSAISKSLESARADSKITSEVISNSSVVSDNRRIHFPALRRNSFPFSFDDSSDDERNGNGSRTTICYGLSDKPDFPPLPCVRERAFSIPDANDYQDRIRICAVFTGSDRATAAVTAENRTECRAERCAEPIIK
jgi:hypothetical protein